MIDRYAVWARIHAVWHLARRHDLVWRTEPDPEAGCSGDIVCRSCPDSTDGQSDLAIWCRAHDHG
jgi:hypothetical protein